jgi:hypothetical protein
MSFAEQLRAALLSRPPREVPGPYLESEYPVDRPALMPHEVALGVCRAAWRRAEDEAPDEVNIPEGRR